MIDLEPWINGAAQPKLNQENLNKILIPLPSLSEQQRIVSILDTFEGSIQNLEAQLEQRQKQYEYYRNKLLTFDKI
jgi:type I restriction enzyme S subunit